MLRNSILTLATMLAVLLLGAVPAAAESNGEVAALDVASLRTLVRPGDRSRDRVREHRAHRPDRRDRVRDRRAHRPDRGDRVRSDVRPDRVDRPQRADRPHRVDRPARIRRVPFDR